MDQLDYAMDEGFVAMNGGDYDGVFEALEEFRDARDQRFKRLRIITDIVELSSLMRRASENRINQ